MVNVRYLNVATLALLAATMLFATPSATQAQSTQTLQSGQTHFGRLSPNRWKHFRIFVSNWNSGLKVVLYSGRRGNPDVYIRKDQRPTLTEWDFRPYKNGLSEIVTINSSSAPALETGWYFISVHARGSITPYNITATFEASPSQRGGMGAIPYDGGTTFRVWAPFADSVHVAGEFNGWSQDRAELGSEGNGFWSMDHRNANPNQQYQYVIRNGESTIWRNDPREEQVTNSVGNSVIFDPEFQWTDQGFNMPSWNETVIYEMHIGTLNDQPGGGPGTFDSAIDRLDHIQAIGCNAVCVMPIQEFPGDFSWATTQAFPLQSNQLTAARKL